MVIVGCAGVQSPGNKTTSPLAAECLTSASPPPSSSRIDPFPASAQDPFAVHAGIPVTTSDGTIAIPMMDGEVGVPVIMSDGNIAIPVAPTERPCPH